MSPALAWPPVVCVALGGAFGSVLRYFIGVLAAQRWGDAFPWGTLSVNLLGSFLFGVLWGLGPGLSSSALLRALLLSGVLGGFTTFSSLMFDSVRLLELGRAGAGLANLALQNVFGVGLLALGLWLGRQLGGAH
jgi:CrcB protein